MSEVDDRLAALENRIDSAESKLEAISKYITLPPLQKGERVKVGFQADIPPYPKKYTEGVVVDFHYLHHNWFVDVEFDEKPTYGGDKVMKVHLDHIEVVENENQVEA